MKKRYLIPICFLCLFVVLSLATVGYAYFSKHEIYRGFTGAKIELLFDKLNETGMNAYRQASDGSPTAGLDKEWGSKDNPYIISNVKHLYNLAELQRLGYFYTNYIKENYTDESNKVFPENAPEGGWSMPYFRVCTPDGTPVTINGESFEDICSIGTETYPFIGSIKGAFVEDNCMVDGKSSDVSAIYNISVKGNPADVDNGLFGYVGVIGNIPKEDPTSTEPVTFNGQMSEISDLLLYDVTVKVDSSLFEKVTEFIEDHVFTFTNLKTEDQEQVPHENHHIGILAGHVCYAKVEYISVYYSKDDIVAIDLKDTTETVVNGKAANYMSSSGIIGFIDNMNPTINDAGGITAGSGTSNNNLTYSSVGGGGDLSGDKAGYVYAQDLYNTYHWINTNGDSTPTEDTSGTILIKDALNKDGNPLCTEWLRDRLLPFIEPEKTGRYYFWDGVFTFALSGEGEGDKKSTDTIEPTWIKKEIIDGEETYNNTPDDFGVGTDNPEDWTTNYADGADVVVAFIKPITNDTELLEAVTNKENIFVAQQSTPTAAGVSLQMLSLYESSAGTFTQGGTGDDAFRLKTISKPILTQLERESVLKGLNPETGLTWEGLENQEQIYQDSGEE